jgi:Fic family protein
MIFLARDMPEEYSQVIKKINELREKLRFATSDSLHRWTGLLARTTLARVIQGTNTIEGINVTLDDAVAAIDGEEPPSAQDEDRLALLGFREAMTYIVQLAKDRTYQHNEGTIKSLHFMMLNYDLSKHPGRWRPGSIHITNTATNQIVYEGPDAALVPGLMKELIDSLNTENKLPVIVKAAMAHLNLTMIHPFSDGNGRMARALQTMVLSRDGILAPQFSSIEDYIGKYPNEYYAILAEVGKGSWHPENDALPWIRFCLVAHYQQAETLLRRLVEVRALWNVLEEETKKAKLNERVISALADAALGLTVRNSTYRKQADISNQVAKKDLGNLFNLGFFVAKGERRGRYYQASDVLKEIRSRTRVEKTRLDPFLEIEREQGNAQQQLPGLSE